MTGFERIPIDEIPARVQSVFETLGGLAAYFARNLLEARSLWKPFELDYDFTDGERFLVAVPTGFREWDLDVIMISLLDGDAHVTCHGDRWRHELDAIEWWCPLTELDPPAAT